MKTKKLTARELITLLREKGFAPESSFVTTLPQEDQTALATLIYALRASEAHFKNNPKIIN